jgi:hypothetical protein
MKKNIRFILLIFAFLCLPNTILQAQRNVIKTNVASIFSGQYGGAYEIALSSKFSMMLAAHAISKKYEEEFATALTTEKGYNIIPEFRYYMTNAKQNAPQGFFIGANVRYEKTDVSVTGFDADSLNTSGQITNLGYGLTIGQQWIFGKRMALEVAFNPYLNTNSITGKLAQQSSIFYEPKEGLQTNTIIVAFGLAF